MKASANILLLMLCSDLCFGTQVNSSDQTLSSVEFGLVSPQYNYSPSMANVEGGSEADALTLQEVQNIPADTPLALAHIRIPAMIVKGGKGWSKPRDLLVIASHYFESIDTTSGGSYIGQSSVWERISQERRYNESSAARDSWQIFQTLETAGPVDLEPFEIDGTPWLAVANVSCKKK
jgi:hypothetical protein